MHMPLRYTACYYKLSHHSTDTRTRFVAESLQSLSLTNKTYVDAYRLLRTTRTTSRHSKNGNFFVSDRYSSMGDKQPQSISDPSLDDSTLTRMLNMLSWELAFAVERTTQMMGMRLVVASLEKRSPEKFIWRSRGKRSKLNTFFKSVSGRRRSPAKYHRQMNESLIFFFWGGSRG